jgi:Tol biopolymer transport system component/DNA-binding winged helix-turn-helix (wHTH) protein
MSFTVKHFYRFGGFALDSDQKVLLREGKPLPLTLKALEMLLILVENGGQIVTKAELMERLWRDTFVEESNLTSHVQQLRKTLGDNARQPIYIETVARRGYRFIAPVEEVLSDSLSVEDKVSWRVEVSDDKISDPRSRPAYHTLEKEMFNREASPQAEERGESASSAVGVQASPEVGGLADSRRPALTTEMHTPAFPAQAPARPGKKRLAIIALSAVALGCVVLLVAKLLLNRPDGKDSKAQKSLAVRVEKLTGAGQCGHAAISPDGKYVAFAQGEVNAQSVWLRQLGTNTNLEIIPTKDYVFGLAFSNSGDEVYVIKGQPTALYRVSLLGGAPTKVASDMEGHFSLSPDDRQVAFIRSPVGENGLRQYSLMVAGTDGSGERPVLVRAYPDKLDTPLWSPDGRAILCAQGSSYGGGRDIKIIEVNVADGSEREVLGERFYNVTRMAWAPRKDSFILAASRGTENTRLWQISYPGGELTPIAEDVNSYRDLSIAARADVAVASQSTLRSFLWAGDDHNPEGMKKLTPAIDRFCWTPTGQVVFTSVAGGASMDLWVMKPDGSDQKQLTANAGYNSTPVATPDGRYIVFMSNRSGSFQVWRLTVDTGEQIQLTQGGGKNHPAVSRDGRWVLYNTTEDFRLWKVSINGGQPVQLTDYYAMLPAVSPDGRVIACVGRIGEKREIVIIPSDGGTPMKRLPYDAWGYRLQWTPDGKALLYEVSINGVSTVVRQGLEGGTPDKVMQVVEEDVYDFGYSPDSQTLAVTRGSWHHDILLITGLN